MAGREETSSGSAELAAGATAGLLEQEPQLDPGKDVRENVEDGVRRLRDLLTRFEEISAAFAEPDADFDALIADQAKVQEQIDRADAWSLDATIERAMDALRLPDGDRDVTTLSGGERRRVALARLLLSSPDLLAARRADEPSRRRVGRVARALPRRLRGNRRRGHARPVLPRQRRGLDPRARPRQGHPVRGELLGLAGAEAGPARRGGEAGVGAPPRARAGAGVGAGIAEGAPREVEGARRGVREAPRRGEERQARPRRDPHPGRTAPRRPRRRSRRAREGLRRQAAVRGRCRFRCRPAGSSASSGRTARARRRCSG